MLFRNVWLCASSLALATLPRIAAAEPEHDIHFLSEHAPESAMDAHYQALPWPAGPVEPKRWGQSVDFSSAETNTDFIELDGPMIAFSAATGFAPGRGYELLGYYSTMDIAGGSARVDLTGDFLDDVPLDLPAPADFTNPRGTFRHYGVGGAYVRDGARSSQLVAGLLLESIDAAGYEMDYTIAAGADAGVSGVLDYSHHATFVTPFVGWQWTGKLLRHWSWSPRFQLTYPLPPGDLDRRLTGPGFDLGTPEHGDPIPIGDPYVAAALALAHEPSGLEIDLGSTLFFPLAEHVSHAGVDEAFVLHVAWRRHAAPAPSR
jgi:hypothetical protein